MKTKRRSAFAFFLTFAASAALAYDSGADGIIAVTGRTSPDYVRTRQKDGTFVAETYSFGKGGDWAGAMKDDSIDLLSFLDVAHVFASPLASQNYIPSTDPAKTKLLIMVYWGLTHAPIPANESTTMSVLQDARDAVDRASLATKKIAEDELTTALAMEQAENLRREHDDLSNIEMLGYESWLSRTNGDKRGTAFEQDRRDLYDEIEQNRYFVVLMAYDFQILWKEKKHRLLWETRFSVRQEHHHFDKELPSLAQYASRYFGQDSGGLVHDKAPQGQVEVGDVRNLGEAAPSQK